MRIRRLQSHDTAALHSILRRVAVFEPPEIRVAEELIDQHLAGSADYQIYVAEDGDDPADGDGGGRAVGYVCHGHNPVTDAIHDVYWVAVDPDAQGRGIGRALLAYAEQRVREVHGRGIAIETSGLPEYGAARRLYEACGYSKVAEIADFYKPGSAMLVYMKFV